VSQSNTALVQSLYAAFGRGDIATILGALTPDVDWDVNGRPQDYPTIGRRKGPAGVQEFFRLVGELQQTDTFEPREFYVSGDKVFVMGHYAWTIKKTGRKVAADWIHVFTIKDGKVTAFREFTDTARFAEAYRG
jgi:ketosteroid isomerase-like protein